MNELHHTKIKGPLLVIVVLIIAIGFALVITFGSGRMGQNRDSGQPSTVTSGALTAEEKEKMIEAINGNTKTKPLTSTEREKMTESLQAYKPAPLTEAEKQKMMEALRAR